jgi:hypothetical protein
MCNGSSSRISHGGTIAILHPSRSTSNLSGRLLFKHSAAGSTIARFESDNAPIISGCSVVIHQTGDARVPTEYAGLLHEFRFTSVHKAPGSSVVEAMVPERYDFGVGERGIIGRRISVFQNLMDTEPIVEGVIGWN